MIILGQNDTVGSWVMTRVGGSWYSGQGVAIGLASADGIPLAGVVYEDYNGKNVVCHIAAVPGRRWLNREYLCYIFRYPFEQLKCHRITVVVAESNQDSRNFVTSLGFTLEATLKDAHPAGDLLVFRMLASECKWLKLTSKEPPCNSQPSSIESSGTTA